MIELKVIKILYFIGMLNQISIAKTKKLSIQNFLIKFNDFPTSC